MENTERNTQPTQNTNSMQNAAANPESKQPGQQTQSDSRAPADPTKEKKDWDLEQDLMSTERRNLGHAANEELEGKDPRGQSVA